MAVTIMFGLTFRTGLTMVLLPVMYAILFRIPNPELAPVPNSDVEPKSEVEPNTDPKPDNDPEPDSNPDY